MEGEEGGVCASPAVNGADQGNAMGVGDLVMVSLPMVSTPLQGLQLAPMIGSADTPEPTPVRAGNGKPGGVGNGKSINLHAFNLFAAKVRPMTRGEHPGATAHEIERLVGQRWATAQEAEKMEFVEFAQREHDIAVSKGLASPSSARVKRTRRRRSETEADILPMLGRRKRGRPSKSELLMRQAMESQHILQQQQFGQVQQQDIEQLQLQMTPGGASLAMDDQQQRTLLTPQQQPHLMQQTGGVDWTQHRQIELQQQYYLQQQQQWPPRQPRPSNRKSRKRGAGNDSSRVNSPEQQYVGQKVQGVLDGIFSAGYFLTVRVGDTNKVLRGVVFRPGVSIPITPKNDVAPYVKVVRPTVEAKFSPPPAAVPEPEPEPEPAMQPAPSPLPFFLPGQAEAFSPHIAQSPVESAMAAAPPAVPADANNGMPPVVGPPGTGPFSVISAARSPERTRQATVGLPDPDADEEIPQQTGSTGEPGTALPEGS